MKPEDVVKKVSELKAQGIDESVIIYGWAEMVKDGKLTPDQFEGLLLALGKSMPREFMDMSEEEKKAYIVKGL